jgi:hypothetical protein
MLARRKFCALILAAPLAAGPLHAFAGSDNGQKKKGGGISYIQFQTLTATIVRPDGRRGVLTVEVGVDIPDPGLRARANMSLPRLRAAYVQLLMIYAGGLPPGSPPDADYLSQALQAQTDQALGRPGARLLLGTILTN